MRTALVLALVLLALVLLALSGKEAPLGSTLRLRSCPALLQHVTGQRKRAGRGPGTAPAAAAACRRPPPPRCLLPTDRQVPRAASCTRLAEIWRTLLRPKSAEL